MGWRDHLPVHPAADLFPLMAESELRELGEDIKKHGGLVQAVHLYKGKLLDGRNRLDSMELVGFVFDDGGLNGLAHHLDESVDPYEYVIAANLRRRHLTGEQKRELIAKVLKAKPGQSNRKIAKQTKADDKTVAKVRREMESGAEIPQLEKTEGADGKKYKAKKKTAKPSPAEIERDRKECVALYQKVIEAEKEAARATGSAEVSIEQRRAENAALDPMPTEEEADESWRNDLYDQACLLLERMADATRLRFVAYLLGENEIVGLGLRIIEAMNKDQRAQFFAKYTELSAAKAPPRP